MRRSGPSGATRGSGCPAAAVRPDIRSSSAIPATGRRALYVSEFIAGIDGMDDDDAHRLAVDLLAHADHSRSGSTATTGGPATCSCSTRSARSTAGICPITARCEPCASSRRWRSGSTALKSRLSPLGERFHRLGHVVGAEIDGLGTGLVLDGLIE